MLTYPFLGGWNRVGLKAMRGWRGRCEVGREGAGAEEERGRGGGGEGAGTEEEREGVNSKLARF